METVSAIPAYGRDYKNKAAVLKDFLEGKDFNLQTYNASGYFSIRDLEKMPHVTHINFRYAKLTKVCVYEVAKQKML